MYLHVDMVLYFVLFCFYILYELMYITRFYYVSAMKENMVLKQVCKMLGQHFFL